MSFGLTFVNNKDVVTLDSEFSRLVIVESGTWTTNSSQNTPIFFKSPVTTTEPPLVFVRPNAASNLYYCQVIGAPGKLPHMVCAYGMLVTPLSLIMEHLVPNSQQL